MFQLYATQIGLSGAHAELPDKVTGEGTWEFRNTEFQTKTELSYFKNLDQIVRKTVEKHLLRWL